MATVVQGSKVRLHYRVRDDEGNAFVDTFANQPISLLVGSGTLLDAIESQLEGMQEHQSKTFTLSAEDAYGEYNEHAVHIMSRELFPETMAISEGTIIGFTTPAGEEVAGMVKDFNEYAVEVDFNHPLAGRNVQVEVEIDKILQNNAVDQKDEVN